MNAPGAIASRCMLPVRITLNTLGVSAMNALSKECQM